MIRRIRLENWRAYRRLDLKVEAGTTFLVAPNGVGKSSLLEAVRWLLAAGHVEHRASMIRQGHREATASVTVDVPGGDLVITRVLKAKGSRLAVETSATLAGRPLEELDAFRRLEDSWSADARFVSRTAFLTEDLRRDAEEPNLRTHLCRAYSLDDLQGAIAEIEPVLVQLSRSLKASRAEISGTEEQLRVAEEELVAAAARLAVARAEGELARAAHAEIMAAVERARGAEAQRVQAAAWRDGEQRLRQQVGALAQTPDTDISLPELLATLEDQLARQVESARETQAALRARLDAAEAALSSLHDADAACPVCLRALDDDSRGQAEQLHREAMEAARLALERVDDAAPTQALNVVRQLARQVAALGTPPEAPDVVPEDIGDAEAASLAAVEAAAAALREAELAESAATAQVEAMRADLETASALTEQYRSEALLQAARSALDQTITAVLSRQLEPVAAEVNRRWEAVFPDRPNLHVRPDGQISRLIDDDRLEFGAFSAGEQTVAKLMMRITTLLATTTVPFCWVDEPLEHLDPVSRQLVASTLAHLNAPGSLEQIFVTTYEEPLARRLAELQPDRVRVQYLRTEPSR